MILLVSGRSSMTNLSSLYRSARRPISPRGTTFKGSLKRVFLSEMSCLQLTAVLGTAPLRRHHCSSERIYCQGAFDQIGQSRDSGVVASVRFGRVFIDSTIFCELSAHSLRRSQSKGQLGVLFGHCRSPTVLGPLRVPDAA